MYNVEMLFVGNRDRTKFYVPIEPHISECVAEFLEFTCYRMPGDAKGCSGAEDV